MHRPETVQLKFDASKPAVHRGWVKYFVAALGLGMGAVQAQQQQVLLDYWWVMPREEVQNAPRVIRVIGAKGERFEEVYAEEQLAALQCNPAIMQARVERQAALRREAQQRARELREAGKSPAVAYEEAWAEVYSRRWLNVDWRTGSSKLEDMLNRLAAENEDLALTEEEQQWVLEALLEDDDRLESEQGRALLSNLARRLRSLGYGRFYTPTAMQDELMERFAEALRHGKESMAAYRDALFKTNRDRIMHHELRGYVAPWGMGAGGGGGHYRQAPIQLTTTVNTGNSPQQGADIGAITVGQQHSAPVLNAVPGAQSNFLADAPSQAADKEEDEEEDKDKEETGEDTDAGIAAAAPSMMMRSFAMRAVAAAAQNEGGAGTSGTTDSQVQGEVIELSPQESIDVGANRVTGGTSGGSLKNVQMLVTGEISRPVTGDNVTVHNLITSADGTNPGILTGVTLYAGTATEYASLHNIEFAGVSSLTGFVTFEKTQATGDMSVADGGTLTLGTLTFDLRGVSMGEKTLFVIEDGGKLEGWNADNVHFVYSGVKVNSAAVDLSKGDGKLVLSADHKGNLYWNGAADDMWNIGSVNWSSSEEKTVPETFTALSNVYFGGGNAANRKITVTQDMVVAKLGVTDGGYSFSGARVAVLGDASLNPGNGAVTFNDQLVVQGGLLAEGSGSVALLGGATIVKDAVFKNLTTTIGGDMTVGGKLTVEAGDASTAGTLTITGNVTAKEMELVVNGGSASVSGNLTTTITENKLGSITIDGTAEQRYTGIVTAGKLTVNTTKKDVFFSRLHVDELTVGEGATVHVRTSADSVAVSASEFPVINLCGTLALDAPGATYNRGYQVNVQSDAARLIFGDGCTIDGLKLIGKQDDTGYADVAIEVNSTSATVTEMQKLGTLKVETGSLIAKNAEGAVHGALILDGGKLKLESDNIMASGSGEILLENGGRLDIGTTTQTLYANNVLTLSGTSTITGAVDGGGLLLGGDSLSVKYESTGNSIDAKLTVEEGKTIILESVEEGSSLEIGGRISGSGSMNLTGKGEVILSGNTGFTGLVTVNDDFTLTLQNTDSLSSASVVLNEGGTLSLDATGAVTLKDLTFSNGSTLAISSIVGTDGLSAQDAALQVGTSNIVSNALTLNVHFADTLDTMTTYNIMSGLSTDASINNLSFVVKHNGVDLSDSQYTLGVHNGVLYIYTMMGNVWDGARDDIWFAGDTDTQNGNWSGLKYIENKEEGYTAAIFRDLTTDGSTQASETVTVQGKVSPGDIYFTAKETQYELVSNGTDGRLAVGTNIHKIGKNVVTLNLENNATVDTALGDVDVQAGSLILDSALAVKGTVTVEKDANLKLKDGTGGLTMFAREGDSLGCYTVSSIASAASTEEDAFASLSGVTMDAVGIRGSGKKASSADKLLVKGTAHLSNLTLTNFEANQYDNEDDTKGIVTLSDVTLDSSGKLRDVVIGTGVDVAASGSYILSGNLTFDSALTNNGTVTLSNVTNIDNVTNIGNVTNIEIGKITPTKDAGRYKYTFINGGSYQFIGSSGEEITSDMVSINGVKLSDGLVSGIIDDFTDNKNGSFTLSFTGDTVGIPQWDERWGKTEKAPSLSRRYAGNDEYVELAAGLKLDESDAWNTNYYRYSSIVSKANADKVNAGQAIVVTLSEGATGNYAVGGLVNKDRVTGDVLEGWRYVHNVEVWIDDRSSIKNIIGGLDNEGGSWTSAAQSGATHVLVEDPDYQKRDSIPNDYRKWDKSFVIAGSRWCDQTAESFVTVLDGEIYTIFGGSCGGYYLVDPGASWYPYCESKQTGTSHVFIDGGRIGEIFAAGMYSTLTGTQMVEDHENKRAVEMVLTGGVLGGTDLRVFGGTSHGTVNGDIYVRMEGSAEIKSRLVGGSNAGTVNGDIVLDLISGQAYRVDAAGLGWYKKTEYPNGYVEIYYEPASIKGDVLVNLYKDFKLGIGADVNLTNGIYGGREQSNHLILLKGDDGTVHTSTLHFAEGAEYENLAFMADNGYDTSDNSIIVTGFDRFELENKAHVVLGLGLFDVDMDPSKELVISGKGVVEVIGHGVEDLVLWDNYGKVIKSGKSRNLGRNIQLEKDATLKISTSVIGASGSEDDRTITVTDGSTIDFSGAPAETAYAGDSVYAGLGFKVVIEGNGVDGKGALYKGKYDGPYDLNAEGATSTANRIVLPNVKLQDDASVGVEAGETLYMNAYALGESSLDLAGYTFTKLGAGNFITRSVKMTPGTVLVQQGTFGFDKTSTAAQTDMVLAAGAKLKLDTDGAADLELRSLIGSGMVFLNGQKLTLNTEKDSAYYSEYMVDAIDKPQAYDQFSETTGFAYAVFSGLISDSGKLAKAGSGVQYISGSSNTYTGGTLLQDGRLYLLGTSEASGFSKDESTVASGVVGKSDIVWASDAAELYLGHGTRIYNQGATNVQDGSMTIGVEAVTSSVLEDFVGIHGTVTMGGVEYVEIDTHNLRAIDVDALYEDGSSYVAGTDIDHDKKLLVKKTDRGALADFIGVLSSKLIDDVVYVEIDTHNLKSIDVNAKYADEDDTIDYVAGTDIDHTKKLLVKESDLGAMDDFISIHGTVALGGVKYVEIDTHNLKSIAVNALYADGTAYVAGTDIDRNKMLLVKMDDWETAKTKEVTSLSDNGYNEAVYSGTLSHSDNVTAGLRKVGMGTLVLDQSNSYTGGTKVEAGTLRLRGWATLGSNVKNNTATVQKGATLMFTHNHGYVNGTTSAANDIVIDGPGDARWEGNSATDGGTAALISAVGPEVTFTLSGDISGSGNVRHCGDGKLVLSGDSIYTGGTVITRGVVEVQSARGLGATAEGKSAVVLNAAADLHLTVEDTASTEKQLVTKLASAGDDIQGDVRVTGNKNATERVLHMADNGYNAASTTLDEKGTFLLCGTPIDGAGIQSHSAKLTGSGTVVVSDATGSGTTATFDKITDYTGDFRVEGDKATIQVDTGTYAGGSIDVSGQQASVHIGSDVSIVAGESLQLSSTGVVPAQKDKVGMGTGAVLVSHGRVSVAAGAELSASKAETVYVYNLSDLTEAASVTVEDVVLAGYDGEINAYHKLKLGADVPDYNYNGRFDADIAINQQAVAGVMAMADEGLTLAGGSTYKTDSGHISLMGGSLTLDTLTDNQLTFNTTLDVPYEKLYGDVQLVLFSDVSSVNFIYGDITETAKEPGVYYTRADNFLTGCDYIDSQTMLVYDSHAGVVYLQMHVPEPTTSALGLLALTALCARRRR